MTVTRNVIVDLLPLYLAGEASADTRSLVEAFMKEDPAFAADMRARVERGVEIFGVVPGEPPDREKETLERVRKFNRRRTHWLGFALAYTMVPFAFAFDGERVSWIMLRDSPKQAVFFWIAAGLCWLAYYVMGRRLSTQEG